MTTTATTTVNAPVLTAIGMLGPKLDPESLRACQDCGKQQTLRAFGSMGRGYHTYCADCRRKQNRARVAAQQQQSGYLNRGAAPTPRASAHPAVAAAPTAPTAPTATAARTAHTMPATTSQADPAPHFLVVATFPPGHDLATAEPILSPELLAMFRRRVRRALTTELRTMAREEVRAAVTQALEELVVSLSALALPDGDGDRGERGDRAVADRAEGS